MRYSDLEPDWPRIKGWKGLINKVQDEKEGIAIRYNKDMKNKWFYEQVYDNKFENLCEINP